MRFTLRKDLQRTTDTELSEKLRAFKAGGRYRVAFFQKLQDVRQDPGPIRSSGLERNGP